MKLNICTIQSNDRKNKDLEKKNAPSDSKEKSHSKDSKRNNIVCSFRITPTNILKNDDIVNGVKIVNSDSSVTEIGVVRVLKRKNVKRIYLPEQNERGVGSFHLTSQNKNYRSSSKRNATIFECETGNKDLLKASDLENNILHSSRRNKYNNDTKKNKNMKYIQKTSDLRNRNVNFKYNSEFNNLQYTNEECVKEEIISTIPKSASISSSLRRRYENLKKSSQEIFKHNEDPSNNNKTSILINQDTELNLEYKQVINKSVISSDNINPSSVDDKELRCFKEGVAGMFKLWNDKYNFESDDMKINSHDKKDNTVKTEMNSIKCRRKKFLWFKTKKKNKISKTYIAGRCQINNGFRLQCKSKQKFTNFNMEKDNLAFDSWIKIYQSNSIESREKVKVRWNNDLFTKSNSTILKLFDALYNNKRFCSSQSEILSNTCKSSYLKLKQRPPINNHNIEAWALQKTILDNSMLENYIYNYAKQDNCLKKKEFIEKSKAFSKKIDTILQTENLRSSFEKSCDYLKMHIPRSYLLDSSKNSDQVISEEAVNKIIDYETNESEDVYTEDSKIKHIDQRNVIKIGKNVYIKIKNNLVKLDSVINIHNYSMQNQSAELRRIENKNKLAETYIQDYFRNSLDVNSYTQSGSDSSINNEIMTWSSDEDEILYSYSSCNVFHSEDKSKQKHTNLFKKFKYWTVSRTNEAKEVKGMEFTRTWPKDSLEVHKRRKLYAISKQADCGLESSSNMNMEKIEIKPTETCTKKSNLKRKGISFNEPLPERAFSGILRQGSTKSIKCASSEMSKTSCNKAYGKLGQGSNTSSQKSILKISDKKSSTKCDTLTKDTSCKGLFKEPSKNSSCNICSKEIIIIKDKICKESDIINKKCDATTSTKLLQKPTIPCQSNKNTSSIPLSPLGLGESLTDYPGPLNSNISDRDCINQLLKKFNPATPTIPPKYPIASLSNESVPTNIEMIRRKSLCPAPKCSKDYCKKSNCNLNKSSQKPSKCNSDCYNKKHKLDSLSQKHSQCKADCCKKKSKESPKKLKCDDCCKTYKNVELSHKHSQCKSDCCKKTHDLKESLQTPKCNQECCNHNNVDLSSRNESKYYPNHCKKSNCSLEKIPKTTSNCNPEWCKANSKPSLPFTPGVNPALQRQARKDYCNKEVNSNESINKTKNAQNNNNVKTMCSCSSKPTETPTKTSHKHVCKGSCLNTCCTIRPNIETKTEKSSAHPGFKLQVIPSKHKSNNNNEFVLNSMNFENETSCRSGNQEPLNVNSLEIKTSMLDGSNMPLLKERELSILNDVYTSQVKIDECKTNLSKIPSSSLEYDSKSSISDLVEIKFKLKIKKGDKNTEVKVENHNMEHKLNKKRSKNKKESSKINKKDVYLMQSVRNNKYAKDYVDIPAVNNDVNITITLRNNDKHQTNDLETNDNQLKDISSKNTETDNKSATTTINYSDLAKSLKNSSFKTSYTDRTLFTDPRSAIDNVSKTSEQSRSVSESDITRNSSTLSIGTIIKSNKAINTNINEHNDIEDLVAELVIPTSCNDSISKSDKKYNKIIDNNFSIDIDQSVHLKKTDKKERLKKLMKITKTLERNDINVRIVTNALKTIFTSTGSCESTKADYREFKNEYNRNTTCCCKHDSLDSDGSDKYKPGMCQCSDLNNQYYKNTNINRQAGCCCKNETDSEDSSIDIGKVRTLKYTRNLNRVYNKINKEDGDDKRNIINNVLNQNDNNKVKELVRTDIEDATLMKENKTTKLNKVKNYFLKHKDLLQSEEVKKAVLSIYAENTTSNNNLIVNLPKWFGNNNLLGNLFNNNVSCISSSESL